MGIWFATRGVVRATAAAAAIAVGGCGGNVTEPNGPGDKDGFVTASYTETDEEFPNPERGLLQVVDVFDEGDIEFVRELGVTLGNARVVLDDFRAAPLSDELLAALDGGLADVRAAGLSLVMRFQYNTGAGDDAPLALVRQHIEQLGPVLRANADVIAVVQAGFIGAWGEWHSSSNGLDDAAGRAAVLEALLAELPTSHMVQVRAPRYKDELLPGGPVDEERAFSAQAIARVGHHNDCFLSSDSDNGTYDEPIEEWKAYVAVDGAYVPIGGESCDVNAPRSDCAAAVDELRGLHWSYANRSYYPDVIDRWRQQGCFDEIRRNLGYRFVLRWARWTEELRAGQPVDLELGVQNVGYAAPFKPRPVYLVVGEGAQRVELELEGVDPRRWRSGETTVVTARATLPADLAAGPHRLALWLPSAAETVRGRTEYAVRFANEQMWSATDGVNVLAAAVEVFAR